MEWRRLAVERTVDRESGSYPSTTLLEAALGVLGRQTAEAGRDLSLIERFMPRVTAWEKSMAERTRRIMLVEDDHAHRLVMERTLCDVPRSDVVAVTSGENALVAMAAHAFDLLIVDLHLGSGLTGMEFVVKAREHNEVIPIVMLSGVDAEDLSRVARKCRANAAMVKPCDPAEMLALIERLLG